MPYTVSEKFKRAVSAALKSRPSHPEPSTFVPIDQLQTARMLVNRQFDPEKEVIPNLLTEGETILFIGRPKIGKSRLLLQMMLSICKGIPFMDLPIPIKKRVLYIDIENKPRKARKRLNDITHHNAELDNLVLYTPKELFENLADLSLSNGHAIVRRMIELSNPDVMVIDTLRLFMGADWDERRSKDVLSMYRQIGMLRKDYPHMSIILVHHTRKTDFKSKISLRVDPAAWIESASGHFSLVGHSEATWGFDRELQIDESEQIIFNGVARNQRVPLFLMADCADLSFSRLQGEEYAKAVMTAKERQAWETAKEMKRFKFSDLEKQSELPGRILAGMVKKAQALGMLDHAEGSWWVISTEPAEKKFFWDEKD